MKMCTKKALFIRGGVEWVLIGDEMTLSELQRKSTSLELYPVITQASRVVIR